MSADEIARAAEVIRAGGLVAFPTETVYGLGANALDQRAVRAIYAAKGRPASSPLIVHVSDVAMARTLVTEWPALADTLAAAFWPGPLTMVLPKHARVPDVVTAGLPSVGIRIPAHPIALELISAAQLPIAAPSANRFTEISPTTAEHVRAGLGSAVEMVLDGGPSQVGIESTVVSLVKETPEVLRPGMITLAQLEKATGVSWRMRNGDEGESNEAPGLHPRHYAPKTPLYILRPELPLPTGHGRILDLPQQPAEFAASLYAELHDADGAGWDWIAIEAPPDTPEWAAIRDRLQRASFR